MAGFVYVGEPALFEASRRDSILPLLPVAIPDMRLHRPGMATLTIWSGSAHRLRALKFPYSNAFTHGDLDHLFMAVA